MLSCIPYFLCDTLIFFHIESIYNNFNFDYNQHTAIELKFFLFLLFYFSTELH